MFEKLKKYIKYFMIGFAVVMAFVIIDSILSLFISEAALIEIGDFLLGILIFWCLFLICAGLYEQYF